MKGSNSMKSKFVENLVKFAVGPMGAALIGFITIPITTWLVTPEQYGLTTMFSLVQILILSFIYLGIDQAYVREYHSYKGDKSNLLLNAMLIPMTITGVVMLITAIFIKDISVYLFGEINYNLMFWLIIWMPFAIIERFLLLNIRMQEKGLYYSAFNILVKFLIMILTLGLLLMYSRTYISIILATLWGQILADLIILILSWKSINFKGFKLDKNLLVIMSRFGLPLLPAILITWVFNSTDRIALDLFCTLTDIGVYFAAMKIVAALNMIQTIFATFWTPMAYRWHIERVDKIQFTRVSYGVFVVMGILFIGILLFKEVFVWILSPEYAQAQYILPFLLFNPIMYTVSETTVLGINFARKTHLTILISVIAAITNILINIILVPYIGSIGAAIGTGFAYIVFFWVRTIISRKYWYRFNLKFYIINIFYLLVISTLNIIIHTKIIYFVNLVGLFIYLFINIPFLIEVFDVSRFKYFNNEKNQEYLT